MKTVAFIRVQYKLPLLGGLCQCQNTSTTAILVQLITEAHVWPLALMLPWRYMPIR